MSSKTALLCLRDALVGGATKDEWARPWPTLCLTTAGEAPGITPDPWKLSELIDFLTDRLKNRPAAIVFKKVKHIPNPRVSMHIMKWVLTNRIINN